MSTKQQPLSKKATEAMLLKKANFETLSTVKQAELVHKLSLEGFNQKEISDKVGVSVPQVSNLLTIHEMPKSLKKFIEDGKISGTLVLQVRRERKDLSDDAVADLLHEVYNNKNGKFTKKDLNKFTDKHNSISIAKKFMKRHSRNSIKRNEVAFELLNGIFNGKVENKDLNRVFGISA